MFQKWPGVVEALQPIIHTSEAVDFFDWRGTYVTTQSFAAEKIWGGRINGHRGEIHRILYEHAKARGIDIRLGQSVTGYFEDDACAGIEVGGQQRITADVVLVAEGVRSPGRRLVLGSDDRPQPSGYAVYRAWFPSTELAENPMTRHLVDGDTHTGWIGQDVHFLAAAIKNGKELSWVFFLGR
jgi:2-polyprenyl-6-methoxyphenol hydroxylase-like FAD-dependent oxidoreductase